MRTLILLALFPALASAQETPSPDSTEEPTADETTESAVEEVTPEPASEDANDASSDAPEQDPQPEASQAASEPVAPAESEPATPAASPTEPVTSPTFHRVTDHRAQPPTRFGIDYQVGRIPVDSSLYSLAFGRYEQRGRGVRLTANIVPAVGFHVGWQHRNFEGSLETELGDSALYSTVTAHQFNAGARLMLPVKRIVYPYASVEGIVSTAQWSLGSDRSEPTGTYAMTKPGIGFLGGLELRTPQVIPIQLAAWMEAGHSLLAGQQVTDLGQLPGVQGLVIRGGVGLRF